MSRVKKQVNAGDRYVVIALSNLQLTSKEQALEEAAKRAKGSRSATTYLVAKVVAEASSVVNVEIAEHPPIKRSGT